MIKSLNIGRWAGLLSLLLVGACGKPTAEEAAKTIAEKECDCMNDYHTQAVSIRLQTASTLLTEAKAGKFKSQSQVEDRRNQLGMEAYKSLPKNRPCEEEIRKLKDQADLDYPRDEDRKTMRNLRATMEQQCNKARSETQKTNREKEEKLGDELRLLTAKLPYGGM